MIKISAQLYIKKTIKSQVLNQVILEVLLCVIYNDLKKRCRSFKAEKSKTVNPVDCIFIAI